MKIYITHLFLLITISSAFAQNPGDVSPNAKVLDADFLHSFNDGYAVTQKGDADGLVDSKGNFVFDYNKYYFTLYDLPYVLAQDYKGNNHNFPRKGFINGLALVSNEKTQNVKKLYHFIDTKGKDFFANNFIAATPFLNGKLSAVLPDGKNYYVYKNGLKIPLKTNTSPNTIDNYDWKEADLLRYQNENSKYGFCDLSGKIVIPCQYDDARAFTEGFARVMKVDNFGEKKWAFINSKGQQITEFMFSKEPHPFRCGLAFVEPKDRGDFDYAYLDKSGKIKIKTKSKRIDGIDQYFRRGLNSWAEFTNGYARWRGDDLWDGDYSNEGKLYIDTTGRRIDMRKLKGAFKQFNKQYNGISGENYIIDASQIFYNNNIIITFNSAKGIADASGVIIIPPVFSEIDHFDPVSQLAHAVYKQDYPKPPIEGYINKQGVFVIVKGSSSKW